MTEMKEEIIDGCVTPAIINGLYSKKKTYGELCCILRPGNNGSCSDDLTTEIFRVNVYTSGRYGSASGCRKKGLDEPPEETRRADLSSYNEVIHIMFLSQNLCFSRYASVFHVQEFRTGATLAPARHGVMIRDNMAHLHAGRLDGVHPERRGGVGHETSRARCKTAHLVEINQ